ncbi:MAG: hypothetical protein K2N72_01575 [Oscillospiraceae bacterium]|nr:hypothetical protein [Oscillospiraceae bacterium]
MTETEYVKNIMNTVDKRRVRKICEKIIKECKADGDPTELMYLLAVWLYIFGHNDESLTLCGFLQDRPFSERFIIRNTIDKALCLKARILREQGKTEESREISEFVKQKRDKRFYTYTDGWNVSYDKSIGYALSVGDRAMARNWRNEKLTIAIQYRETASSDLSDYEMEEMIAGLLEELKTER